MSETPSTADSLRELAQAHEAKVKELQEQVDKATLDKADLKARLTETKAALEAAEAKAKADVEKVQAELAAVRKLLVYVRDWVRGRSPRKVASFDNPKLVEITAEADKISPPPKY